MQSKKKKYHRTDALTPRQLVDMQMAYEYRMLKEEDELQGAIAVPKSTGQQTHITAIQHGLERHGLLDRRGQIEASFSQALYKKGCKDEYHKQKKQLSREYANKKADLAAAK